MTNSIRWIYRLVLNFRFIAHSGSRKLRSIFDYFSRSWRIVGVIKLKLELSNLVLLGVRSHFQSINGTIEDELYFQPLWNETHDDFFSEFSLHEKIPWNWLLIVCLKPAKFPIYRSLKSFLWTVIPLNYWKFNEWLQEND